MIVFSIILLLLFFFLMIRVNFLVQYDGKIILQLKILFFKKQLSPSEIKRINYKNFTRKKYLKIIKKEKKKKVKKKKVKPDNSHLLKKEKKHKNLFEFLDLVKNTAKVFLIKFGKNLHVKLLNFDVIIATDDAYKTSLIFVIANNIIFNFFEFFSHCSNLNIKKCKSFKLDCNFIREKTEANISVLFSIRIIHLFSIVFSSGFTALKSYLKIINNRREIKKWKKVNSME